MTEIRCPNCGKTFKTDGGLKWHLEHIHANAERLTIEQQQRRVSCPKCGSLMVLRTAKRGPNAGGKFYGCSRYPNCKATVPFESIDTNSLAADNGSEKLKQSLTATFFPRNVRARSRFQNNQVQFFETVAVSEDFLERFILEGIDEKIIKAFSQWRIDFLIEESNSTLKERQCQIISVLEKILTRGRITLLYPQLETDFKEMFPKAQINEPSSDLLETLVMWSYQKQQKHIWLDSKEEKIFYENILSEFLGENYEQFVLPQVEISSLIPPNITVDTTDYQRVDFAIFNPYLKEKIIVEIDGEQHKRHVESDEERDRILQEYSYTVIRIQAKEIQKGQGSKLSALKSKLSKINEKLKEDVVYSRKEDLKFIHSIKIAHQIQIVLLQAIQSRFLDLEDEGLWHIVSDLDEIGVFNKNESLAILKKSVVDFVELLGKLGMLYSVKFKTGEPICGLFSDRNIVKSTNGIYISFSDKNASDLQTFHIQNIYFPFHIAISSFPAEPLNGVLEKPNEKDLEYFLQYLFRKPYFWEGQYDGITRALQGKDALLLLPTGAGKSIVYQLASIILPGRTVVIDPIISLMEDQIDNLVTVGIDRSIAITSQISNRQDKSRAIQLFGQGEYLFAYISPERFQIIEFRESLRTLTVHTPISIIIVDEAHCVSEWGHDFRTAYLNIGRTSRIYCESKGIIPPLLALTGTASRAVLKDVQRELQIEDFDAIITPKSFDRKELKFHIIHSVSQEKSARLKGYLGQKLPRLFNSTSSTFYQVRGKETYSGLIFCPHVRGEYGVERVSNEIREELSISASIYSGKEPKHWQPDQYRMHKHHVTKEFKRNRIPLLVCTKAFGMGIDKPNIRYTIHYGIPPSIESFYQEAGRAGRDRRTANCCIIVSNDDPERNKYLLDPRTEVNDIDKIVNNIQWEENDDITRVLYFHTKSFRGIVKEKRDVKEVLEQLGDITKKGNKTIMLPDFERNIVEKALHRLLLIGVISDYTIEYPSNEFTVKLSGANKREIIITYGKYVTNYQYAKGQAEIKKVSEFLHLTLIEFIMEVVNLLLHFIYAVIERSRRRALSEMMEACITSTLDSDIRMRILHYLEVTEYTESLEQIIDDEKAGLHDCKNLFSSVRSPNEAAELRGQVSRYLESYPDHPGLLMLRSLSEIFTRDRNTDVAMQNFIASISFALKVYELNHNVTFEFAAWAISNVYNRDKELAKMLIIELIKTHSDRNLARLLIENVYISLGYIPAWFLLSNLLAKCNTLVLKNGGRHGK